MFYPKSPFFLSPFIETEVLKQNATSLKALLHWLVQTPTITTYRVNLHKTTVAEFRKYVKQQLTLKYGRKQPKIYELAQLPEVICIDVVHVHMKSDSSLKRIMVDRCCAAALLRGAHVYAPGVLAMETGIKLGEKVQIFADLTGRCKKGTNIRYEQPHNVFIGEGYARMQRYQLFNENSMKQCGIAIEMTATISGVPCIGDLSSTEALLQNLPSIICVRVLAPQADERILDMCAAPGNKTTHLAEMMGDVGLIVALDKSAFKIKYLQRKIAQYNYKSIRAYAFDATKSYCGANMHINDTPPFAANSFDRILLDAPCSALGNRPLLAAEVSVKILQSYPRMQKKLFENAVQLLKLDGVLVYSTCTVTEAENEQLVGWALRKFSQLKLVAAEPIIGSPGLPNSGLSEYECRLVQRFGHEPLGDGIDTVGFFIAKFRKVKSTCS